MIFDDLIEDIEEESNEDVVKELKKLKKDRGV